MHLLVHQELYVQQIHHVKIPGILVGELQSSLGVGMKRL